MVASNRRQSLHAGEGGSDDERGSNEDRDNDRIGTRSDADDMRQLEAVDRKALASTWWQHTGTAAAH